MVNAGFRLSPVDLAFLQSQPPATATADVHTESAAQESTIEQEVAWREKHTTYETELIPQRIVGVQQGTVASFPLKMKHADSYIGERIVLVGYVTIFSRPHYFVSL